LKQLRKLLWPFSWLYNGVTFLRNQAFSAHILREQKYPIPIINVGNLSTGGTGKSPFVTYISSFFKTTDIAVLSRGYGRKTKGLLEVELESKASEVGDEPAQLKSLYPDLRVVVAENRKEGMEYLLQKDQATKLVILDDAYQHRHVKASFNLLLTTYADPFFKDLVLPAGNLRENRLGSKRATTIVVTKCPDKLSEKEAAAYRKQIGRYTNAAVFFAGLHYKAVKNQNGDILAPSRKLNLLTGIANPMQLLEYVRKQFELNKHFSFADHHNFSAKEIRDIEDMLEDGLLPLLTTRKDFQRLKELLPNQLSRSIYVVDIKPVILLNEKNAFEQLIKQQLI
jgi:tetraacyldisaccharide 4'-kinase